MEVGIQTFISLWAALLTFLLLASGAKGVPVSMILVFPFVSGISFFLLVSMLNPSTRDVSPEEAIEESGTVATASLCWPAGTITSCAFLKKKLFLKVQKASEVSLFLKKKLLYGIMRPNSSPPTPATGCALGKAKDEKGIREEYREDKTGTACSYVWR